LFKSYITYDKKVDGKGLIANHVANDYRSAYIIVDWNVKYGNIKKSGSKVILYGLHITIIEYHF